MSSVDRRGAPDPPGAVAVVFSAESRYSQLFKDINDLKVPDGTVNIFKWGKRRHDVLNEVVAEALAGPAYWIWFINEEHGFKEDVLEMLLSRNEALVAPIVLDPFAPYHPRAWTDVATNGTLKPFLLDQVTGPTTLTEVRGASVTGMLVRRAVFEAMGAPWFRMTEDLPEDVYFCERARELGFQVYVDTSSRLSTLSVAEITPTHKGNRWELAVDVGSDMNFSQALRHR